MSKAHTHAHMWGWWLFSGLWALGTLWALVAQLVGGAPGPLQVLELSGQSTILGIMIGLATFATIAIVAERAEARAQAEREEKQAKQQKKAEAADDKDGKKGGGGKRDETHEAHEVILVPHDDRAALRATLIRKAKGADYGAKAAARGWVK